MTTLEIRLRDLAHGAATLEAPPRSRHAAAVRSFVAARSPEALAEVATHGAGLVLALAAAPVLLLRVAGETTLGGAACAAIYAATLVALYAASTCYHAALDPIVRDRWRRADHCAIYGLIAGTYTPICAVGLGPKFGLPLLGALWLVAFVGAALFVLAGRAMTRGRCRAVCLASYVLCGWSLLAVREHAGAALPPEVLRLVLLGGVAYSAGIVFFVSRRRFSHAVWHLFVLAGSAFHYRAVTLLLAAN